MKEKETIFTKPVWVAIFAILCCALWGSAFPFIKKGYALMEIAATDAPKQIVFAGMRFFLAGVLILVFGSLMLKKKPILAKKAWPKIMILAFFQTILQYTFFYLGLAHISGSHGAIITPMSVFATVLLSGIFFKEDQVTPKKILGCLIGFAGVLCVVLPGSTLSGGIAYNGEGFIFISAITCGFSAILIKIFSQTIHPVFMCGYQFVIGGAVMQIGGLLAGGEISNMQGSAIAVLIYLAILSAVAYTLWSVLLKDNRASKIGIFQFTIPIFGVLLSALILKESVFNQWTLLALVLVSIGVALVNYEAKSKESL